MMIDLVLVVVAGAVFVWMVTGRPPSPRGSQDADTPDDVEPDAPSARDRRAAPDRAPGSVEDESSTLQTFRAIARRRVAETAAIVIRVEADSYAAFVLDYSVDGSGLSAYGTASVQRGDRVRVGFPQGEVGAEVCHPVGQVAEEEWVVGLFFPDERDRLRVLEFIRDVTGEGRPEVARGERSSG